MQSTTERWRPLVGPGATNPSARLRAARSMPSWLQQSRGGLPAPPPPPPPVIERTTDSPPDPDYEVIDLPNQTYSNTPLTSTEVRIRRCDLCGSSAPSVQCTQCPQQNFCTSCDDMYHRHPKRQAHVRKALESRRGESSRPPLPPKGEPPSAPVPPPRRNKRAVTPLSHMSSLQNIHQGIMMNPVKKEGGIVGSLKRMISGGRSIPPPPVRDRSSSLIHQNPMAFHGGEMVGDFTMNEWEMQNHRMGSMTSLNMPHHFPPMMQAHSMAQLNCPGCWTGQHWGSQMALHQCPPPPWGYPTWDPRRRRHRRDSSGSEGDVSPALSRRSSARHRLQSDSEDEEPFRRRPASRRESLGDGINHRRHDDDTVSLRGRFEDDVHSLRGGSRRRGSAHGLRNRYDDTMSERGSRHRDDDVISERGGKRSEDDVISNRGGRRRDDDVISERGGRCRDDIKHHDKEYLSDRIGRRRDEYFAAERGYRHRDDDSFSERSGHRRDDDLSSERSGSRRQDDSSDGSSQKREDTIRRRQSQDASERRAKRNDSNPTERGFRRKSLNDDRRASLKREESMQRARGFPEKLPQSKQVKPLKNDEGSFESGDTSSEKNKRVAKKENKISDSVSFIQEQRIGVGENQKSDLSGSSTKSSIKENGINDKEKEDEEEKPFGPLPTTEWECEHCTFVNQPGIRVCDVCCKTTPNPIPIGSKKEENLTKDISCIAINEDTSQQKKKENPKEVWNGQSRGNSRVNSKGTSPPPQSISTQTYDVAGLQLKKNEPDSKNGPRRSFSKHSITSESQQSSPLSPQRSRSPETDSQATDSRTSRNRNFDGNRRTSGAGSQPPDYMVQKQVKQGLEMVKLLRDADEHQFSADDLAVALDHCGDGDPIEWLLQNWKNMIDTVVTLGTNYGHERKENTIGTISAAEARDALRIHSGNVWAAVTECVQQRQKKYAELLSRGNFSREDIVTVLTAHHGNLEAAYTELNKGQLKPFLMRIWGPPQENEPQSHGNSVGEENQSTEDKEVDQISIVSEVTNRVESWLTQHVYQTMDPEQEKKELVKGKSMDLGDSKMFQRRHSDVHRFLNQVFSSNSNSLMIDKNRYSSLHDLAIQKDAQKSFDAPPERYTSCLNLNDSSRPDFKPKLYPKAESFTSETQKSDSFYLKTPPSDMEEEEEVPEEVYNGKLELVIEGQTKGHRKNKNDIGAKLFMRKPFLQSERVSRQFENKIKTSVSDSNRKTKKETENLFPSNEKDDLSTKIKVNETKIPVSEADLKDKSNKELIEAVSKIEQEIKALMSESQEQERASEMISSIPFIDESEDNQSESNISISERPKSKNSFLGVRGDERRSASRAESRVSTLPSVTPLASSSEDEYSDSESNDNSKDSLESGDFKEDMIEDNSVKHQNKIQQSQENQINPLISESRFSSDQSKEDEEPLLGRTTFQHNSEEQNLQQKIKILNSSVEKIINDNENQSNESLPGPSNSITEKKENKNTQNQTEEEKFLPKRLPPHKQMSKIPRRVPKKLVVMNKVNTTFRIHKNTAKHEQKKPQKNIVFLKNINGTEAQTRNAEGQNTQRRSQSELSEENLIIPDNNKYDKEKCEKSKLFQAEAVKDNTVKMGRSKIKKVLKLAQAKVYKAPIQIIEATGGNVHFKESQIANDQDEEKRNGTTENIETLLNEVPNKTAENQNQNKQNDNAEITVTEIKISVTHGSNEEELNQNQEESSIPSSEIPFIFTGMESNPMGKENRSSAPKDAEENSEHFLSSSDSEDHETGEAQDNKEEEEAIGEENPQNIMGEDKLLNEKEGKSNDANSNSLEIPKEKREEVLSLIKESLSKESVLDRLVTTLFGVLQTPNVTAQSQMVTTPDSEVDIFFEAPESPKIQYELEKDLVSSLQTSVLGQTLVEMTPTISMATNLLDVKEKLTKVETAKEREVRKLLAEGAVSSYDEGTVAWQLMEMEFTEEESVSAARECRTLAAAMAFLQQECPLCTNKCTMKQMVGMLECDHRCCTECAVNYFTLQILEKSVWDCVCPYCRSPDLRAISLDQTHTYFSHLDIILKGLLSEETHELFQRKLRDWTLSQDPNFTWCCKCSSGYIANPNQKRLMCPDCRTITCASCKRPWVDQHEGKSCAEYSVWLDANDPDSLLDKHLEENGIMCPKCKTKFSLAKGGCMHMTCSHCKHEFCSGCSKPFLMGDKCKVSEYCQKLGLHSHHPRNCLFYLRDKEPATLEKLLKDHGVNYIRQPEEPGPTKCPINLIKETHDGLVDAICNQPIESGGLCRTHYIEHLVRLVRSSCVDPALAMDITEATQELWRRGKPVPDRTENKDSDYLAKLIKIVQEEIPLE